MKIKQLKESDVIIEVTCEPEPMAIEGNASAWGDEEDKKHAQWIRNQLKRGNEWAWCIVVVTARYGQLEASTTLGGCCYRSENDFRRSDGNFEDMKAEVIKDLQKQINELASLIVVP